MAWNGRGRDHPPSPMGRLGRRRSMYKRQEVNSVQSQLCRAVFFHASRTLPSYPALTRALTFLIYSRGINDHFHSSFSLAARMGKQSRVLGPGYGPHGASDSSEGTSGRACVHCLVRNCTSVSIDKPAHKKFWHIRCAGHGGRGTAWHEEIYCWRRRRLWWLKGPHQALGPGTISRRRMEIKRHRSFCAPVESWHTE